MLVLLEWDLFFRIFSIIKKISIETKKIEVIKDWPKFKSIYNI